MANYFTASSSGNVVIIDDRFRNMSLAKSGNLTTSAWSSEHGTGKGSVSVSGEDPIIAIRSSTNCALLARTKSGSTYTFTVASNSPSVTVPYYIFDTDNSTQSSNGLVIYNEDGKLVFDANRKYMRVVGMINGTIPSSGNLSKSIPSGITPAIVLATTGRIITIAGGPVQGTNQWRINTSTVIGCVRISGNAAYAKRVTVDSSVTVGSGSGSVPTGSFGSMNTAMPIIDVSHY